MHRPKTLRYQSHFKNIVKSINLTVRLKADNELKLYCVMYCVTRVCVSVCVSVRGCTPTLLRGPGCNLG